jgi:catechol 2,3-dioxygenase-like lactoylglutathione lyase family enzyme
MIDHISLRVKDYAESKRFYDAVLGTLGYRMLMEFPAGGGYGDQKPEFWIGPAPDPNPRMHIAFKAKSRAQVDAFYAKALELGAQDNGKPGPRPEYHAHYYGAFVIDPNGHNLEAVIHTPEKPERQATKTARKKTSAKKARGAAKKAGARKKAPARRGR